MIGMGLYEAGRRIEAGQTPSLRSMLFVKGALRQDLFFLGTTLLIVYLIWLQIAEIIYALSSNFRVHRTIHDFASFVVFETDGRVMALWGTLIGGVIAFCAYALVVVSAPMMLDRKVDVFTAAVTSVRAVLKNVIPMLIWAALIVLLTAVGIATACVGLVVTFPVIGLASWRAYRELVPDTGAAGAVG